MGFLDPKTPQQVDQAITAVRNGVATRDQEQTARDAAKQAGSRGNRAKEAFKGK